MTTTRARPRQIPASTLVQDFSLYPRAHVDEYHVREIMSAIESGAQMPPVIADEASKRIVDGFHRVRAAQRLHGPNAPVSTLLYPYENDAAIFKAATELNATHGRNLSVYDKTRVLVRGEELHMERAELAKALNITLERANSLVMERVAASGEVLKRTMSHLSNKNLTQGQRDANTKAGGLDQLFYINQVIALLETGSIDTSRERVVEALGKLRDALGAFKALVA